MIKLCKYTNNLSHNFLLHSHCYVTRQERNETPQIMTEFSNTNTRNGFYILL